MALASFFAWFFERIALVQTVRKKAVCPWPKATGPLAVPSLTPMLGAGGTMKKILVLLLALSGCAHKGSVQEEFHLGPAQSVQVDSAEVQRILDKRPQLPKPFRLGVYFRQPQLRGVEEGIWSRWSVAERQKIFRALETIPEAEVSAVFAVATVPEESVEAIRVAAARQGAHAVLIVNATGESVNSANGLAFGYLLLAPIFFLHGNDVETLFSARATLWDVRNEFQYLTAEGEAQKKASRPLSAPRTEEQLLEVRAAALTDLCDQLQRQLDFAGAKKSGLTAL